jgi:hypothetical protein
MRKLEIINVEAAGPQQRIEIIGLCHKVRLPRSARLTVYTDSFNNELSIHIQWNSRSGLREGRSPAGCELCRAVSGHGTVNHTVWVESRQSKPAEHDDKSN